MPGLLLASKSGKEIGKVTVLADSIKRWCEQESLAITVDRDDEVAFVGAISLPGEPALSVAVRASGGEPVRLLLSHSFELPIPAEMAADAEKESRIAALVERVAASRSTLLECRQTVQEERMAIELAVTVHEDGMSKQGFLTALEEVRKVGRVVEWELEALALTAGLMSEVRSDLGTIVERADTLASDAAKAAEELQIPAAPAEVPPPPAEGAPLAAEPGPAPSPPPTAEAAPTPAARFCPSCGRQAKKEHRFCIGCGSSLDG